MKNSLYTVCLLLLLASCSKNDNDRLRNPNLLDINFQFTVNMSLPKYSPLKFASNPVYVNGPNYGNAGVIIINTGAGTYRAFDAADPNHPVEACSTLIIDGIRGTCGCNDGNSYNLFTGQPLSEGLKYRLLEYRVINNGNGTLTVWN